MLIGRPLFGSLSANQSWEQVDLAALCNWREEGATVNGAVDHHGDAAVENRPQLRIKFAEPCEQVTDGRGLDLELRRRSADDLKILPALRPIVGRTTAEARAKYDQLQELLDPLVGLARLNQTFGDLSAYPLDGPVPLDKLGPAELRSISAQLLERVRRQNPTIRQLYQEVAGMGGFCLIGTPTDIADVMQDWFEDDACDGFNITPTHLPGGCEISWR